MADGVARADGYTGEAVKEALEQTKDFEAVTGTLSVDENHNAVKDIVVIGLEDGVQATSEKVES